MTELASIKEEIDAFARFVNRIGRETIDVFDRQFHDRLNHINDMTLTVPEERPRLMSHFYQTCFGGIDKGVMQTHSRNKPMGYPGDFQIIDWIYTKRMASSGVGRLWDQFYHRQMAPKSVRNRKEYFCKAVDHLYSDSNGLSVLNLACGSCRDIAEATARIEQKDKEISFHCVDMDSRAIAYAKQVVNGVMPKAIFRWETANVFRLRPPVSYNLVWSAGLFDYLPSRHAVILLKKMWHWTKEGGILIFGNFHPENPTRNYMEWAGDWFLIHRTEEEMLALCRQAGIPEEYVSLDQEPLGINRFCIVTKE